MACQWIPAAATGIYWHMLCQIPKPVVFTVGPVREIQSLHSSQDSCNSHASMHSRKSWRHFKGNFKNASYVWASSPELVTPKGNLSVFRELIFGQTLWALSKQRCCLFLSPRHGAVAVIVEWTIFLDSSHRYYIISETPSTTKCSTKSHWNSISMGEGGEESPWLPYVHLCTAHRKITT